MKHSAATFVLIGLIILLTGCGPIGPMPGLAIGGQEQTAPDDFAFTKDHDLIQIRTFFGGWFPQVHHIWGVAINEHIYAIAVPGASWRARVKDNPQVLLRIGDNHYSMSGVGVDDEGEKQRVFVVYMQKYGPQLEEILGRPGTIEDMSELVRFTAGAS